MSSHHITSHHIAHTANESTNEHCTVHNHHLRNGKEPIRIDHAQQNMQHAQCMIATIGWCRLHTQHIPSRTHIQNRLNRETETKLRMHECSNAFPHRTISHMLQVNEICTKLRCQRERVREETTRAPPRNHCVSKCGNMHILCTYIHLVFRSMRMPLYIKKN